MAYWSLDCGDKPGDIVWVVHTKRDIRRGIALRRFILASLLFFIYIAPAGAQQALQGKVERQDGKGQKSDYVAPNEILAPVRPKMPSFGDLRPVQGAMTGLPSGVWSMTMLPINGLYVNSSDITWSVECANPKLHHDWQAWLSRVVHHVFCDCARFRCQASADDTCTVIIRKDGAVVIDIVPDANTAAALFRNAVTRLEGQGILRFPPGSQQEKSRIQSETALRQTGPEQFDINRSLR